MRLPQPFYREQTKCWYVQIGKKQHRLDPDKDQAIQKYHALMARRQPVDDDTTVVTVLYLFLDWSKKHQPASYEFYERPIKSFAGYVGDRLKVGDLKLFQVRDWIDETYPGRSQNYHRNLMRGVQRPFNWAEGEGRLTRNPLAKLRKPAYVPRDVLISPEQWQQLEVVLKARGERGQRFLDLVTLMRQTGCRPQEARAAEARHLDNKDRCLVFEKDESKGKKERRVVPLTDAAFEMCVELATQHPIGPLFRNPAGEPWTNKAVKEWFRRLDNSSRKHPSKTPTKPYLAFRLSAYAIRHTWATEALERGVDPITVATIMGHKDVTMLMKVYQHLQKKTPHLRAAMQKAVTAPLARSA